ncbi:class I lanthipeptide [Chitinophaga nivalis]|uniref:Class I lanthipeptide n=1 Tax=Chitinophaga nivalis TaxID=2991709 RepID=A0ABT3ILA6_9BACT|nr:class I lanthipeptide [Chitinophaga nivalis]MCW3465562.1 class I lanthipeptide [Chitinophaga nivalis]MCW3484747.1 class I lanthipeptide [Chitinophaga nivalis]
MKRKQISLNKKLFLGKVRIAELNNAQQLILQGGIPPLTKGVGCFSAECTTIGTTCATKRPGGNLCIHCNEP